MAVEVAYDGGKGVAVMFCNTSDTAFGPVFTGATAEQDAEDFIEWLRENEESVSWSVASAQTGDGRDPRDYDAGELERVVNHWRALREDGDA